MVRCSFCVFLILFLLYYYIFSLFLIPPNSRGSKDLSTASANKGNYCPSSRKIKEISRENARYIRNFRIYFIPNCVGLDVLSNKKFCITFTTSFWAFNNRFTPHFKGRISLPISFKKSEGWKI